MFKTAALTLAAIVASASIASADTSYISTLAMEQDKDSKIELGTVRAAGDGVVEIYQFHRGETGPLLGSETVHAGANSEVNVNIQQTNLDAIAVLKVNGEIVDTQEIHFN